MAISYDVITDQEWQGFPEHKNVVQAQNPWAEALELLERGETIAVTYEDARDLKGKRLSIGRRAGTAGFKIETRFHDGTLAIRRKEDEGWTRPAPAPQQPQRTVATPAKGRRTRGTLVTAPA